jgi:hypothetical protein
MLLAGTIRIDGLLGRSIRFFNDPGSPLGGFSLDGLRLIVLVPVMCGLLLTRRYGRHTLRMPVFFFVFGSYALVSLIWTQWPIEGVRLMFKMLYPLLTMWIVMGAARSLGAARKVAQTVTYALALNVGLGALSVFSGAGTIMGTGGAEGVVRQGTFVLSSSPLAMFLSISVFVTLAFALNTGRLLYLFLAMGGLVQLILTYQRMGWLMFLGGVGTYAILARSIRMKSVAAVILIATLLAPVAIPDFGVRFLHGFDFKEWFFLLLDDPVSAFQILNTSGRFEIYSLVFTELILPKPITGWGAGSFQYASANLIYLGEGDGWRLIVDLGMVGLLSYFLFILALMWRILRNRRLLDAEGRWISIVAVAVLVQYSLSFLTDNPLEYYDTFSQYVFAIVAVALIWPTLLRRRYQTADRAPECQALVSGAPQAPAPRIAPDAAVP